MAGSQNCFVISVSMFLIVLCASLIFCESETNFRKQYSWPSRVPGKASTTTINVLETNQAKNSKMAGFKEKLENNPHNTKWNTNLSEFESGELYRIATIRFLSMDFQLHYPALNLAHVLNGSGNNVKVVTSEKRDPATRPVDNPEMRNSEIAGFWERYPTSNRVVLPLLLLVIGFALKLCHSQRRNRIYIIPLNQVNHRWFRY